MVLFKNKDVLFAALEYGIHPTLLEVFDDVISISVNGKDIVVTSAHRDNDHGVHGTVPARGLDIRSWAFANPEKMVNEINKIWQYDPTRPNMHVALMHDVGKGMHIHLQVHPNTIRRNQS